MSTASDLLRELREHGIGLRLDDRRLVCDAPVGAMTPDLQRRLRAVRSDVIRILSEAFVDGDEGVVCLRKGKPGAAIYCLCGVDLYRPLAQRLQTEYSVFGVYIPDEEVELYQGYEASYRSIDELGELYAAAIDSEKPEGPIHLVGFSFGGVLVYEVAVRLHAKGYEIGLAALLDTLIPRGRYLRPARFIKRHVERVAKKGPTYMARRVRRLATIVADKVLRRPAEVMLVENSFEVWQRRGRLYRRALDQHTFVQYDGELVLVRASDPSGFEGWGLHPDYGWSDLALGGLHIHDVHASHSTFLREPGVAELATLMEHYLGEPRGEADATGPRKTNNEGRHEDPRAGAAWSTVLSDFDGATPLGIDLLVESDKASAPKPMLLAGGPTLRQKAEELAASVALDPLTPWVAAWATLLRRYGGSTDVLFDLGAEGSILPIRVAAPPDRSVQRWLSDVDAAVIRWRSLPAITARQLCGLVGLDNATLCGSAVLLDSGETDTPHVLALDLRDTEQIRLRYDSVRVPEAAVARIGGHLTMILDGLAAMGAAPCSQLPLLTIGEHRQIIEEWNATETDFPRDRCLHELFEEQVAAVPNSPAVIADDETLTYAELDARANQLARHLQALGVVPDTMVGICLQRNAALIVALLAIAKAGGAYVPLDPSYPVERLDFMLRDASVPVLIAESALGELVAKASTKVVLVDEDAAEIAQHSEEQVRSDVGPENLAYAIFTSGSTGRPKGVMVDHRGRVNNFSDFNRRFEIGPGDRTLAMSSLGFDMTAYDVFGTLIAGATIVLVPSRDTKDPAAWADLVATHKVTVWHSVPALLDLMVEHVVGRPEFYPKSLRVVLLGGDWIPLTLPERLWNQVPTLRFISMGGATEVSMDSTIYEVVTADPAWNSIPYGAPMANQRAYLLDPHMQPTPVGVVGELYLGGIGVGRGYHGRPELTATKFLTNPFIPQERIYRTGDLARWGADGNLELLGRVDYQVKIRGIRIEIGEIEAALREYPSVREGVVMARPGPNHDKKLVAYVLTVPGQEIEQGLVSRLRAHLEDRLPIAMVPSAFVVLREFPLTPNGKIDRRALPEPEAVRPDLEQALVAPRTDLERVLAEIWTTLLNVEAVGVHDGFLALGGSSLQATQLAARLIDRFSTAPPIDQCMASTIESLAATMRTLVNKADTMATAILAAEPGTPPAHAIPRRPAGARIPASDAQRALWFIEQLQGGTARYNVPAATRLHGPLDVAAMGAAFDALVARHEVLRSAFASDGQGPVQSVQAPTAVECELCDLSALPSSQRETEAARLLKEFVLRPFDLEAPPLLRARIFRLDTDEHVLAFCAHHIAIDGWSMGVVAREIDELYRAAVEARAPELEPLPIQFGDFAVWEQSELANGAMDQHLPFWREELAAPLPVLELPLDHSRDHGGVSGGHVDLRLSPETTKALEDVARTVGATSFESVMALVFATLHRITEQDDIVVGATSAGRPRTEQEELIGDFVNTLPLRIRQIGTLPFPRLLARVHERMKLVRAHDQVPFGYLVDKLNPPRIQGRNPMYDVSVTFFDTRRIPLVFGYGFPTPVAEKIDLGGLHGSAFPIDSETSKFDLTFLVWRSPTGIEGALEYDAGLMSRARAKRLAAIFTDTAERSVGLGKLPQPLGREASSLSGPAAPRRKRLKKLTRRVVES